jgi:hypothetical protein
VNSENPPDINETAPPRPVAKMPVGYRLLLWFLIIDLACLTGWVWMNGYMGLALIRAGWLYQAGDFVRLLLSYHVLLLAWSLIAYEMEVVWKSARTLALFPLALIVCLGMLHLAAARLAWVVSWF